LKNLSILTFFIIIFTSFAVAQQGGSPGISQLPSLQWQKQELSDRISNKIERALTPVIGVENFYTDVEIKTLEVEKPQFNKTDEEIALDEEKKAEEDKGFDVVDEDEEKDEESEENKDPSKTGKITFNSADPAEMPKDYVIFSKLGIEAPLIDDYNDFQPDGKIVLQMSTSEKASAKKEKARAKEASKKTSALQKKLEALKNKPKPSMVEQIWKYNESIDIFRNIDSLKITVSVNEDVDSDVKKTVNAILTKLNFNVGEIKPKLEIKFIEFGVLKEVEPEGFFKSLSRFSTAFGLVLGALLLCGVAWVLFKKFEELKQNETSTMAAAMGGGPAAEEKDDDKDDDEDGAASSISMDSDGNPVYNGIERFKTFLETNDASATLLIKRWISLSGKKQNAALKAIVQQLENKQLVSIFANIEEDDRETWKEKLNSPLTNEEVEIANKYISNQIVEEIIVPDKISDPEVADILMKIEPAKAAEFIKEKPVLGQFLLNILNTNFISQVFEFFNDEELTSIVSGSLGLKDIKITDDQLTEMKSALEKFKRTKDKLPFVKKLLDLIPMATPRREKILFHSLGQVGDDQILRKVAEDYFPAELVTKLPEAFVKSSMQSYPLSKRVELLSVLSEDDKNWMMNAIAPAGSKAADMLDLEFEKNDKDISFKRKIQEEGDQMHKEYIEFLRKQIERDKSVAGEVSDILDGFVHEVMGTTAPNNVTPINEASEAGGDSDVSEAS